MSKEISVKIDHASQEIMVLGAQMLGLKKVEGAQNSFHLPNGKTVEIRNGEVEGNFWLMGGKKVGEYTIKSQSEDENAEETIGAIRRAGLTETVATYLINDDFDVNRNVSEGTVMASRRSESISIRVGLDGLMHSDMGGFEGEACSLTMQKLLDKLPTHSVESVKPKTQPQHVVRTQE